MRKQKITVMYAFTGELNQEVDAHVIADLAVNKRLVTNLSEVKWSGEWTVTHIRTGCRIVTGIPTFNKALLLTGELETLGWGKVRSVHSVNAIRRIRPRVNKILSKHGIKEVF